MMMLSQYVSWLQQASSTGERLDWKGRATFICISGPDNDQSIQPVHCVSSDQHIFNSQNDCRLLSSFQTSLDEITMIAMPETPDSRYAASKSVQILSYVDPGKGERVLMICRLKPQWLNRADLMKSFTQVNKSSGAGCLL